MLSSHVYWNLDGYQDESLSALNHTLMVASSSWLKTDGILVRRIDVRPAAHKS